MAIDLLPLPTASWSLNRKPQAGSMQKLPIRRIAIIVPGGVGETPEGGKPLTPLVNLLARLAQEFEVTVYSLSRALAEAPPPGTPVFRLRATPGGPGDPLPGRMARIAGLLLKDHFTERYCLVHGFWAFPAGFLAVLLGKLLRIPSMVSLQGGEAACVPHIGYGNMLHPRLKKITLWTCRRAGELTALTRFQAQELRRFGLEREAIRIIPYGAEAQFYPPGEKKLLPPYRFLHVGNLTEVKDQPTLLRAFARVSRETGCELRMVGPDYLKGELQSLAGKLGIAGKVTFTGHLSHAQLPAHYQWAQVLLHTSYYEGQGIVIAEAAAAGVAIAGTAVGLIADLGESCAVTAPAGDDKTLAEKLLFLLRHPEAWENLRRNARQWALQHDAQWTARQFVELYQRVLEEGNAARFTQLVYW